MAGTDIWQPTLDENSRYFRLFLSHTHAHRQEVGLLASALLDEGIAGFVAHDSISATLEWENEILRALRECEALAAYLTADFPGSDWTDQEVGVVVGRGLLVLALNVEIVPYGFMGRYQAMKAASGIDRKVLAAEIADALRNHVSTKAAMAEATVDRFVRSYSFDDARANLERLQRLPTDAWTPEMVEAVKKAVAENGQIEHAYFGDSTVPAEANKLVNSLP
jgi:TIR domain